MQVSLLAAALIVLSQALATPAVADGRAVAPVAPGAASLAAELNTPTARDAMARVAYAEAGNQGESGLAGVVYTIINRLIDGRWGGTVEAVVDAPHQFEPVMRAGGTWRRLPSVTPVQEAAIHTIVALALQGQLPDLTGGARYFQNRQVVSARAAAGLVPQGLIGFGGAAPSARIGDHTFYPESATRGTATPRRRRSSGRPAPTSAGSIFFRTDSAVGEARDPLPPTAGPQR